MDLVVLDPAKLKLAEPNQPVVSVAIRFRSIFTTWASSVKAQVIKKAERSIRSGLSIYIWHGKAKFVPYF